MPRATSLSSSISQSSSPWKQKYSSPTQALLGSGTIHGLQERKFWMRPTLTPGSCTYIQLSGNSSGCLTMSTTDRKSR